MIEKENTLVTLETSLATFANRPIEQLKMSKKINERIYELFEIKSLLTEVNNKFFEGKGEIIEGYHNVHLKPEFGTEIKKNVKSRFSRLFSTTYDMEDNHLTSELYCNKENLNGCNISDVKKDPIKAVGIMIYQVVGIPEETFSFNIAGRLYIDCGGRRYGRWKDSPVALIMQSHGRFSKFSLNTIPPAVTVRMAFWEDVTQTLTELSEGGFIPKVFFDNGGSTTSR